MYTKDDLCFEVAKQSTSEALNVASMSDNCFSIIGHPKGEPTLINTVSDRYRLTPVSEHLGQIEDAIRECFGSAFSTKYRMVNYSKFYVDYILDEKLSFQVDDLQPRLRFQHSYNGKLKTSVEIGIYRVICKNGATTLERLESAISFKNTIGNYSSLKSFVSSSLERLNKSNTLRVYEVLAERAVPDFANRILEVANVSKFPKKQIELVAETLAHESDLLNVKPNDWLIYNAFNYQLNHNEEIQAHDEFKFTIDNRILQYMYKG